MNRGDIWLIDLGGRVGRRPVLVLTRQNVLQYVNKVTVAEITTKGKGYPTEIDIDQKATLPRSSFVQADNLHSVPKQRLDKYVGTLDPETMRDVSKKVVLALELEGSTYDVT
jgi:mRNA interferase MazF